MKIKNLAIVMALATLPLTSMAQSTLKSGINVENLDRSINPADDFYRFACGGWMKNNPLPAAYSRFGSFDQLQLDNDKRINGILAELENNTYTKGTIEQKISDLYKLAMDSDRLNREGVQPVMPYIKEVEACKTNADIEALKLKYASYGFSAFYGAYIAADEKNASMNILNISQGGLTLRQKEYYLDNDDATTAIREAYKKHIVRMFQFFGFTKAEAQAKMEGIMRVETEIAKVSKSQTELRNPEANYNKMTLKQFEARWPNINLRESAIAEGIGEQHIQTLVVGQPSFMDGLNTIYANISTDDYKAYVEWDIIGGASSVLADYITDAQFDFSGKVMSGRQQNYPRWKRSTSLVSGVLGEQLGKMYVDRFFPAENKARMEQLIKNLQIALGKRIDAQTWMSKKTKKAAHEKLDAFYVKVGYPNKWKDVSGLNIDPEKSLYENLRECHRFFNALSIAEKAGKPVNKDEWHMTPQTVNAYYNPTTNEICFPAGILQVPFFDMTADDAFNYGAIGVVIGHEMTHGFDDQGRQYDKTGNMKDWWTKQDAKAFETRANAYADFFSAIKVLPDLNANGKFTLGENLADHGGLQVSFYAFKEATKNNPLPVIDGFTPEQRFFLAYANVWGQNITEKEIRNRVKSDPHSLGEHRVNGALPHIDMWYEAFGVKKEDKMFIPFEERLKLW